MSVEEPSPSRQSNPNKSVNSAPAENPPSENSGEKERPSIEEKVAEFAAEYPRRVTQPLAEFDGVSLRRDYVDVETETWVENQPDIPSLEVEPAAKGESETYHAVEWGEAVRTLLEKYERTKQTTINLEKGRPSDAEYAEFSIAAENRWFASYQKKYYAQLDGWLRELAGGERPSGGSTAATFDEPKVALLTRSASSVPDGERVGPVDHAQRLTESWSDVYHTMRNTLRSEGYELGESWQYDRRLEPHTGKRGNESGTNEAYAHEHIILVVNGDVTADDLRPIIEKHVEKCEWAGAEAHGEGALEVREPDELNDVAAYVADYCSIDPVELWERGPAYIGWAAAMDAGNIRTVSRSEAAREAAEVDKCRQRYESEEAEQSNRHGENVRRDLNTGEIVCRECGTSHDIDQEQTLAGARLDGPAAVADGGREIPDREAELRERWPSADEAAAYGERIERTAAREKVREFVESDRGDTRRGADGRAEKVREFVESDLPLAEWLGQTRDAPPPDEARQLAAEIRAGYDPEEVVGFDHYVAEWHVASVTVDGEERPASAGNQIDMVEITNVRQRLRSGLDVGTERYRCECGVEAYGTDMVAHLCYHGIEEPEVAAELVEREEL